MRLIIKILGIISTFFSLAFVFNLYSESIKQISVVNKNLLTDKKIKKKVKLLNKRNQLIKFQDFEEKFTIDYFYDSRGRLKKTKKCFPRYCIYKSISYFPKKQLIIENLSSYLGKTVRYITISKKYHLPLHIKEWNLVCPKRARKCKKRIMVLNQTERYKYSTSGYVLKKKLIQYKKGQSIYFEKTFHEYNSKNQRTRIDFYKNTRLIERRLIFYDNDSIDSMKVYENEQTDYSKLIKFKNNRIHLIEYYKNNKLDQVDNYVYKYY